MLVASASPLSGAAEGGHLGFSSLPHSPGNYWLTKAVPPWEHPRLKASALDFSVRFGARKSEEILLAVFYRAIVWADSPGRAYLIL